jgi:hypothetical protein
VISAHCSLHICLFTYVVSEHPYVTHCRRYLAEAERDPLFSAPHLKDFLEYLSEPSPQWPIDDKRFTWSYPRPMTNDLRRSSDTRSNSSGIPEKVTRGYESLELLFLSGYPSSRWLKDVGEKYKVDMHFFQQHLSSIRPSVRVDVFAEPSLPSSSRYQPLVISEIQGIRSEICLGPDRCL